MTISYQLSVLSISEHLFSVKISVPHNEFNALTLQLPAWIPGSYMIRDFAKNVHRILAHTQDGSVLKVEQLDKQTWSVTNNKQACFVEYVIYAFDLSVRSAYLSDEYGFINGTSGFLHVRELEDAKCEVMFEKSSIPDTWTIATSLPLENETYTVANYDELIDHPILIGSLEQQSFDVSGTKFHLVFTGRTETDIAKICEDLVPICEHHIELFGSIPCKEYWFLTLLADDGFGGLEHRASTALLFPRFHLPMKHEFSNRSEQYQQFLSLCSHELLHTWHVKKSRPQLMLKPDLSAEVYTNQLWIYEGFTSLYDDLSLARCKLITPKRYAQILSEAITRLLRTPGRHHQTVAESSFNAWHKFYKQDAGSVNHIVSYYNKGAVIALCLDITLRQLSDNKVSLDNIITDIWHQFGKDELGTNDEVVIEICKQNYGIDIKPFLDIAVHTTMDLPLQTLLDSIGLKLTMRARLSASDKGGLVDSTQTSNEFGAVYKASDSGLLIQSVTSESAAANAGIQVNDKLISFDGWQVTADHFPRLLNAKEADSTANIHLFRAGRLLKVKLSVRRAPFDTAAIEIRDSAKFESWIGLIN
ncbi:M61 family metallopeptidase [Glaciecola sp. KUL10]|uniref:M61 family metallopeptidase n=1 Tax=Glaciecola sp. (strain KUL10) TaxID=2161813 RepID=UPI000D78764F|nr:PDZ domain-containing protein [Glaciecola sp. KUL10]GBL02749.1 protease [Glaciecola sp. KUL10]